MGLAETRAGRRSESCPPRWPTSVVVGIARQRTDQTAIPAGRRGRQAPGVQSSNAGRCSTGSQAICNSCRTGSCSTPNSTASCQARLSPSAWCTRRRLRRSSRPRRNMVLMYQVKGLPVSCELVVIDSTSIAGKAAMGYGSPHDRPRSRTHRGRSRHRRSAKRGQRRFAVRTQRRLPLQHGDGDLTAWAGTEL